MPSGKLGEHPDDSKGVKRTWEHKLPFLAQKVIDLGFDLPNPYGVAAIYTGVDQNMALSDLRISLGPSENKTSIPFVTFEKSPIEVRSALGKLDTWVWPFLNAFVTVGYVDGQGVVPIQVPGADALKVLAPNLGARCDDPPGAPLRPTACDEDFVLLDFPNYHGVTIGAGMLLSMGWRNYFVAVPISYNFTDINTVDTTAEAFQGSMRIGGHFKPKHTEMLAFYTGAAYLNTEQDVSGVFRIDTGIPGVGEIDIDYTIHQENAEKWNYLVGFNWTLTPRWWLQGELGFGGQRDNFVTSLTYRW